MQFFDKLTGAIQAHQSLLCVGLDPDPEGWRQGDASDADAMGHVWEVQEWLQYLISQTADLVCAYRLTLEMYRVFGSSGLGLLRHILKAIPDHIPVILDAHYSGLNTTSIFAQTIFLDWQVDAVTLNPYTGQDEVAPFLVHTEKAVFILCATANPSAAVLQEYPTVDSPHYIHLVREAKTWGTPEQVGLEVGGGADIFSRIRSIAPERLILARDVSTDASSLTPLLAAGLNANGDGLILPVPPEMLASDHPRDAIGAVRDTINQARAKVTPGSPSCLLWMPDVCLLQEHPHKDLILQLYDIGCIQFGDFVQASGATFPYYIDLRTIISHPQVFEQVLHAYADILTDLNFDRIAGIPYGSLPTATGLGLRLNRPIIFPRKEVKAHGTRRLVEGKFHAGETVVVIDDILITGNSIMEGAEKLESVGLTVQDMVVFIDHEAGVRDKLASHGYRSYAVLTLSDIAQTLFEAGRLDSDQFNLLSKSPQDASG